MEIHKPKPWHGWREFLKEYLIIVVGVLTALAAEQAVEAIHEQKIAAEAREAVRAEVRENLWWMQQRAAMEPCIRRRIGELTQLLATARRGQRIPVIQALGGPSHQKITSLRWQANAQAGRASLFSGEEQGLMTNMYYTTEQFRDAEDREQEVWARMRGIQGLDRLDPLALHDFSVWLAQVRTLNDNVVLHLYRARQWAGRMHLSPDNPNSIAGDTRSKSTNDRGWLAYEQVCRPLTAPPAPLWPWEEPGDAP